MRVAHHLRGGAGGGQRAERPRNPGERLRLPGRMGPLLGAADSHPRTVGHGVGRVSCGRHQHAPRSSPTLHRRLRAARQPGGSQGRRHPLVVDAIVPATRVVREAPALRTSYARSSIFTPGHYPPSEQPPPRWFQTNRSTRALHRAASLCNLLQCLLKLSGWLLRSRWLMVVSAARPKPLQKS